MSPRNAPQPAHRAGKQKQLVPCPGKTRYRRWCVWRGQYGRRKTMSALIDDISRVIASSVSRRKAFKMVSGAMGSALLASMGLGRAAQAMGNDDGGDPRCPRFWVRCGEKCYPPGYTCCGNEVCEGFQHCCENRHCCGGLQSCCGSSCCNFGSICCGNNTCCRFGVACCNGKCCSSPGAICCGSSCCPQGYFCCAGSCVKKRPSPSTICTPV